ncbi:MAG: glycosyltransferase family 9 protein [Phycisphaerales bacterium]|nr:glycosyltransferase family 9 protein [Phycisphaerales bacterium]
MDDFRRILLIRPSALGDVCRSVPVLTSLRAAFPNARIDWLVQDSFAAAIEHHPALDNTVRFPRRPFAGGLTPPKAAAFFEWAARLGEPGYDLVVDAQGLARSGLLAWMTGAACRIGEASAREGAPLLYTRRVPIPAGWHTVDRMLGIACAGLGIAPVVDMRLHTDEASRARAADLVGSRDRYVLLAPTSRWASKRWPADRFAALAQRLLDSAAVSIVVVGGRDERDQCGPVLELAARDKRVVDLVGQTDVATLMALVERAALVVANDSAALHMGVGFERPCVALFGPTRVDLVGPYRREHDVIQHLERGDEIDHKRDAGAAIMDRIGVDEVESACVARLVDRSRAAEPRA